MDIDTKEFISGVSVESLLNRLRECEAELRRHREMIKETGRRVRDLIELPVAEMDEADMEVWNFAVDAAATAFGVSRENILGRCRQYRFSIPRHTARYLLYRLAKWSSPRVARVARVNHTMVLLSANAVDCLKTDAMYQSKIAQAETIFKGGLNA